MAIRILNGDCRAVLATLQSASVHCIVTSPPYYGMRSYLPDTVKLKPELSAEIQAAILAEIASLGIKPIDHTNG